MKIRNILLTAAAACVLGACTGQAGGARSIDDAARYLDEGKLKRSQAICDSLMADTVRLAGLSAGELCSLAELFVRLDSARHEVPQSVADVNDAMAARCLSLARAIDADSVDAFISAQPRETAMRLSVINSVSTYLDIPRDSLAIEEPIPDSL